MRNPQITVIIPVYKASSTIEKCARSLFGQTMTDGVEFFFIDDCSPDDSIEKLHEVMSDYPQLRENIVIVQNSSNLGVSRTRKRGIKEANGNYIAWVDSDDWVEPTMLENMWNATKNGTVNIVVQNVMLDYYKNGVLEKTHEWKLLSQKDASSALMNYHTDKHVPWGLPFQMSKRSMINEASKCVHDVNITEDAMMLIYLFANAKSCTWLEHAFYHYISVENSTSLTHSNYLTKEEWANQEKNVDDVTRYLLELDCKRYETTANYIKWFWKNKFQKTFDNSWEFWNKYRECYRDVVKFDKTGINAFHHKVKIWLKYNLYPIYWYKEGRYLSFNSNKKI